MSHSNLIRWGILGCGAIAHKFRQSMRAVDSGEIVACASRTPGKAAAFAHDQKVADSYESYHALLARNDIDAVYIATTHNFHYEMSLLALDAGKAVLCEKPLSVNAEQTREIAAKAREKGLFLMEGMWTRFLPAIRQLRSWLDAGMIGSLQMVRADFCIGAAFNPANRLFNPDLAGGAVLDAGIYPISMASYIMGSQPQDIAALAKIGETGVDEQTACVFRYPDGRMALLSTAVSSGSENRLEVVGSDGRIVIPTAFLGATEVELHLRGGEITRKVLPFPGSQGFRFEIQAANEALLSGKTECSEMPIDETIAIAETLDRVLARIHAG